MAWEIVPGRAHSPHQPASASTRFEIAIPTAVRMDAVVIPCFRKRLRMRSASVVSSWKIRLNVSRILLIWDRRAALFAERALSLDCLSIFMSESSCSRVLIQSCISCWISGSLVSVSFWCFWAKCFSTSGLRSSTSDSFTRLFTISSLIPVIAFFSPASSLVAWETHAVSSGWSLIDVSALNCSPPKAVSTCSVLRRALLTTPERSWSSLLSILLALPLRALSACRSSLSAALLNVMSSMYSQWAPVISALQQCHLLPILWPVITKPESRIYPHRSHRDPFVARRPVECFTIAINPKLFIVNLAFETKAIGTVHFVVESINRMLFWSSSSPCLISPRMLWICSPDT